MDRLPLSACLRTVRNASASELNLLASSTQSYSPIAGQGHVRRQRNNVVWNGIVAELFVKKNPRSRVDRRMEEQIRTGVQEHATCLLHRGRRPCGARGEPSACSACTGSKTEARQPEVGAITDITAITACRPAGRPLHSRRVPDPSFPSPSSSSPSIPYPIDLFDFANREARAAWLWDT